MQINTLFGLLSIAIAATARPSELAPLAERTAPSCGSGQVLSCCNSINNGTGLGCIFSTLNIPILTCSGNQATACCNANQVGLINVQCVSIAL